MIYNGQLLSIDGCKRKKKTAESFLQKLKLKLQDMLYLDNVVTK